jgi:large subunit ribosomal protein L17
MAQTNRLSRTTSQRDSLLKGLVTGVIEHGKITTTLAKAKAVKPMVDSIVSLAVKEKDNFVKVEKTISRAKLDKNGKKVKVDKVSKNGRKYQVIDREIIKVTVNTDKASKLAARKKMFNFINKIKDSKGNTIDLTEKLFNDIASKYELNKGGYSRIIKLVARKGDGAEMAVVQLV